MNIDTNKLAGRYVYLKLLENEDIDTLRKLARDERIWEFTKAFAINETFDKQFDDYIRTAFDKNALGGQQVLVIRQTANQAIIGPIRPLLE